MSIQVNGEGAFRAKLKFVTRNKISHQGKKAKEFLRIDIDGNKKIHHVIEQDSEGNWKTVHDENVPLIVLQFRMDV